jgi:hypothetical protein
MYNPSPFVMPDQVEGSFARWIVFGEGRKGAFPPESEEAKTAQTAVGRVKQLEKSAEKVHVACKSFAQQFPSGDPAADVSKDQEAAMQPVCKACHEFQMDHGAMWADMMDASRLCKAEDRNEYLKNEDCARVMHWSIKAKLLNDRYGPICEQVSYYENPTAAGTTGYPEEDGPPVKQT